jgi:hypothetical protein
MEENRITFDKKIVFCDRKIVRCQRHLTGFKVTVLPIFFYSQYKPSAQNPIIHILDCTPQIINKKKNILPVYRFLKE